MFSKEKQGQMLWQQRNWDTNFRAIVCREQSETLSRLTMAGFVRIAKLTH